MADRIDLDADVSGFDRAMRTLDRELQREAPRRMSAISRRERDRIRGEWPTGPAEGGHSRVAVISGTQGLVPYLALQAARYPYVGWLVFGGRRPRDRVTRQRVTGGRWFYPGVARARQQAGDEMWKALQDAKRRAGL